PERRLVFAKHLGPARMDGKVPEAGSGKPARTQELVYIFADPLSDDVRYLFTEYGAEAVVHYLPAHNAERVGPCGRKGAGHAHPGLAVEPVPLARDEHGRRPVGKEGERDDVTLRVIVVVKGEAAHLGRYEKDGAFGKSPGVLERPAHARRPAGAPEPPY